MGRVSDRTSNSARIAENPSALCHGPTLVGNQSTPPHLLDADLHRHVSAAVSSLLEGPIPISLKGLRETLQSQLQVGLEARKSQIKRMAERTLEDWVSGLSLVRLPEKTLAHLRNPYTGQWQPGPTFCRASGRLLFTELHDLVFVKNVTGTNTCVEKGDLQAAERRCTASLSKKSPVLHDLLAASSKVPIARWMLMNGFMMDCPALLGGKVGPSTLEGTVK